MQVGRLLSVYLQPLGCSGDVLRAMLSKYSGLLHNNGEVRPLYSPVTSLSSPLYSSPLAFARNDCVVALLGKPLFRTWNAKSVSA